MSIKSFIKKILNTDEPTKEKSAETSNLEPVRIYIKQQLREKGLKNNQIEIDFSNVCADEEVIKVAEGLGFHLERGDREGVWWLFRL